MAFKQFALDDNTLVTIYKRKTSRSLRLSVTSKGDVRVSIPTWAPYSHGLTFARSRQSWIREQQKPQRVLKDGQTIGKAHHLNFQYDPKVQKPSSRVKLTEVVINVPAHLQIDSPSVQLVAEKASIRALRAQAERLLPQRLKTLAQVNNYSYHSVSIKLLKSRWGSCDQHKNIVLNLYLMQLPWEYIDYVLLHELAHTKFLKHGPEFWEEMSRVLPNAKRYRKAMREYQPILHS